jgi:cell division protein FtsL
MNGVFMMIKRIKAQSVMEYVMLFVAVAAAIMVTYKYVHRSMNARLKQVQEELEYR